MVAVKRKCGGLNEGRERRGLKKEEETASFDQ
jgi:hypothetical protein